jgi:hypothetical protein
MPTETPTPTIRIKVDPTNPGQFFACCGLLELADRLWPGAEGWFADNNCEFLIARSGCLEELVIAIRTAKLHQVDERDPYSSPIVIGAPFRHLSIDWWLTDLTGARDLKVWAGTMESFGIAFAMQQSMNDDKFLSSGLFDVGMVVPNPNKPKNKKEPYYFDSRRAGNAHSRDTGFSTNDLGLSSIAFPAVELLCLIGLQIARPSFTRTSRIYDYFTWPVPLETSLLICVACGQLELIGQQGFRFANWFRTGQRKHKAFRPAIPLNPIGDKR